MSKIIVNIILIEDIAGWIKYFQNLGTIDRTCSFQVRRLSDKTNFTLDRIIMEV